MPRLRTPSLKVRQNAEGTIGRSSPAVTTTTTTTPTPRRGRPGRPKGSTTKKAAPKSRRSKATPWEDDECEQHYGYESHSEDEEENEDVEEDISPKPVLFDDIDEEEETDHGPVNVKTESDELDFSILCPWIEMDPSEIPPLELPESSQDIPIDRDLIMDMIEIYEILRTYHRTLKLTPFTFEDFCAAMNSPENSCLLSEIHIALLKMALKNDDEEQVHYAVMDTNNSVNIMIHSIDSMTYAEVLRQYLESDPSRDRVPLEIMKAISTPNYPFVNSTIRAQVIAFLCYRFLDSSEYKKIVSTAGNFVNDEVCRVCAKSGGELLPCVNCEAVFHESCSGLDERPEELVCDLCNQNETHGVTDCIPLDQLKRKQPLRMESIGRDRHGRIYWFVARRIIVQDESEAVLEYYSTAPQLYELVSRLDPHHLEYNLCKTMCEKLTDILEQMAVTLELSSERRETIANEAASKSRSPPPKTYLHIDNLHRMPDILRDVKANYKVKHEADEGTVYQPLPVRMEPMLGIQDGQLVNTFWSGQHEEAYVMSNDNKLTLDGSTMFRMGACEVDDYYKKYRNHFAMNDYSDPPALRKKAQDRKKYLSTRFSLLEEGEGAFQWSVAKGKDMYGGYRQQAKYIEWTLGKMVKRVPLEMMHRGWRSEADNFKAELAKADTYQLLAAAMLRYEAAMRRTLFHPQFWSSLGHSRLVRTTPDDREQQTKELQKKKKEERELTMADDDDDSIVKVKYTRLPSRNCPQGLWRLKDETYRVAGRGELGGWQWVSTAWNRVIGPLPERPALGVDSMDDKQKQSCSTATKKAVRLHGVLERLSSWRREEVAVAERKQSSQCYSPSCRLGLPSSSVCSDTTSLLQSCYSQSCQSTSYDDGMDTEPSTDTRLPAKAFDVHRQSRPRPSPGTPGSDTPWPLLKPNSFLSRGSRKKSMLIIPNVVLRKLAKTGGRVAVYIPNFSLNAKSNFSLWNYPCHRPCLDLCWRWLTENARSLHAISLQLKILWYCIKWSEFEPSEDDADDGRVIVHHADRDDLRKIIKHHEFPPLGTYERYLLQIESVMLEDERAEVDDDWSDRSDRKKSRSSARVKKPATRPANRVASRKIREDWIDGVELRVSEIKSYWQSVEDARLRSEKSSRPIMSKDVVFKKDSYLTGPAAIASGSTPMRTQNVTPRNFMAGRSSQMGVRYSNGGAAPTPLPMEPRKRNVPARYEDGYGNIEFDDWDAQARAQSPYTTQHPVKRARYQQPGMPAQQVYQRTMSPNRRTSHGYEYDGGMIRGGGRVIVQPVGDGNSVMRRVVGTVASSVPQVASEETIVASGSQVMQGARVMRAAAGSSASHLDEPPVITRYDSQGGGFGSQVAPRPVATRQVVYTQSGQRQVQTANGKVLMIRRSDGTTQYLRPVGTKDGDGPATSRASGAPDQAVVVSGPGQQVRRMVTAVRGPRPAVGAPHLGGPTKVLRIGANGSQMVSSVMPSTTSRLVQQRQIDDDPFMKRMAAEKAGSPSLMQAGQPMRRPISRPVPQRTDQLPQQQQLTYSDDVSADEYAQMAEQGIRPQGRPPARIAQTFGYSRPVQRVIPRGGTTMHMGQRMVQASYPRYEDEVVEGDYDNDMDDFGYGEEFVVNGEEFGDVDFDPHAMHYQQ